MRIIVSSLLMLFFFLDGPATMIMLEFRSDSPDTAGAEYPVVRGRSYWVRARSGKVNLPNLANSNL